MGVSRLPYQIVKALQFTEMETAEQVRTAEATVAVILGAHAVAVSAQDTRIKELEGALDEAILILEEDYGNPDMVKHLKRIVEEG